MVEMHNIYPCNLLKIQIAKITQNIQPLIHMNCEQNTQISGPYSISECLFFTANPAYVM